MTSPNLKTAAAVAKKNKPWRADTATESNKLASNSPTWRGLAGGVVLQRRTRGVRSKLFLESSSDESSESDDDASSSRRPVASKKRDHTGNVLVGDGAQEEEPPSYRRGIIELDPLKAIIERNGYCKRCGSTDVEVEFKSVGVATWVFKLSCTDQACGYIDYGDRPQAADVPLAADAGSALITRTTDYALNVLYTLGFIACGDGGAEAARILGFLGLPNDTTMETRTFVNVEKRIGPQIRKLTDEILQENMVAEVEASLKVNNKFDINIFNLWKESIKPGSDVVLNESMYPEIVCSADYAWQTRGGGNAFNSNSGHGCFVGGNTRKPITKSIKSKYCRMCLWHGQAVPQHECMKNHNGSSKAMEPQAVLECWRNLG